MDVVIILCLLLLFAYLFDLFSDRLNIPSVLVLLLLGFAVKQALVPLKVAVPDLFVLLPGLGQVGLVLIVLDGALELKIEKGNLGLLRTSFFSAGAGLMALALPLTLLFRLAGGGLKASLLHAIALAAVSSAVAIASSRGLRGASREFVIYESSFSDILAVLLFNFVAANNSLSWTPLLVFSAQMVLMAAVSAVAIFLLFVLLNRIVHQIKFVPIILLVILIYSVSKVLHLPALIFILMFGLILNNFDEFTGWPVHRKLIQENSEAEVRRFKDIVAEFTFLIRSFFFLIFGFSLTADDMLDARSFLWAAAITALLYVLRGFQLKALGIRLDGVFYFAPRGLITILLFISIAPDHRIPFAGEPLIFQVVLLSSLVMLFGILRKKSPPPPSPAGIFTSSKDV